MKISLTIEELRFIWSLGFTTGRVANAADPMQGYGWNDETPLWQSDLHRVEFANKLLFQSIKSAQQNAQRTPSKQAVKASSHVRKSKPRASKKPLA